MYDKKLSRYDSADFLDSEEAIAAFLDGIEGDGDGASQLGRALGVVSRARMLTQLASDAGMNRHELVATLAPISSPSVESLSIIARALGVVELIDFSRIESSPPWRARNVIPLPGYRLAVQFQDGVSGIVDLSAVVESSEPGGCTILRCPVSALIGPN